MRTGILTLIVALGTAVQTLADANVLWQIGKPDNNYGEFAIAREYAKYPRRFPSDAVFNVGHDDPVKAWPFIHPGPADAWARSKAHTFRVEFELTEPIGGPARLLIDLVDTHRGSPPSLDVCINGECTTIQTPRGGGDNSLQDPAGGKEHVATIAMAGNLLKVGKNIIEIRNTKGSWMLYDAVRLERVSEEQIQASLSATPRPFLIKTDAGPRQEIEVAIGACGRLGKLTLNLAGRTIAQEVPEAKLGGRRVVLSVPPVKEPAQAQLVFQAGKRTLKKTIDLKPVRPWRIFLVQHTHSDVGYPDTQAALAARLVDFIDAAIDYAEATRDYPDDAKFRWTCEATWSVELFLDTRCPRQVDRLRRAIADGQIELAALPMNMTDLATEQVFIHSLQNIARLRRELGAEIVSAMQNDVNGYALSLPRLLRGCGVKYFATGINRTRSIVPFDRPTGLHWEAPDGSSVLTWRGEHYMAGNYFGTTTDPSAVAGRLSGYLDSLVGRGYPHDEVLLQMSGYHTDDAWPSPTVCDLVRDWNSRYASPTLRVATIREFFRAVEAKDGDKLPRVRKAWCDWWADGNGTAVQEVALIRETHEKLQAGLALLASSLGKEAYRDLPGKIRHAIRRTLMFDEHTWGYAGSISQPDSWMTKAQWGYKSAQAYEASMLTASIFDAARRARAERIPTKSPSLVIQNPASWARGGVKIFRIPAPATYGRKAFRLVDAVTGKPVAMQKLGGAPIYDSTYAIDVPPVLPLGYRVLRIDENAPEAKLPDTLQRAGNKAIQNAYYWVEVDPKTGGLFSLRDKKTDRELVGKDKWKLLQYIYERVDARGVFWPHRKNIRFDRTVMQGVSVRRGQDGPLVKSILVDGRIADGHTVSYELSLRRGVPRVDIRLTVHKPGNTKPEAGYLAFPLALDKPKFSIDAVGGTFQPGPGQIPGTASDYHSLQRYVRAYEDQPDGLDVIVASQATPLAQIGDIHVGQYQQELTPPGPRFFMWLHNNYWFTNFPASQQGELQFGFALTSRPRGEMPKTAAHRFAADYRMPMPIEYLPAGRKGDLPADQLGCIEISPPNVMMTGLTWGLQREGIVLRLREFDGKATTATVRGRAPWPVATAEKVDLLERPLGVVAGDGETMEVSLKPNEMVSIRLAP